MATIIAEVRNTSNECGNLAVYDLHNVTTEELFFSFAPSLLEVVVYTYILPVVMFLGTVGNACFLIMMGRFPDMRSTINYHLTSLAISDLVALIIGGTDKLFRHHTMPNIFYIPYSYSKYGCIFLSVVLTTLFCVSIFNVTLVSYEMYSALCKPMRHRRITSTKRTLKLICLAWTIAFAVGMIWDLPFWLDVEFKCYIWPKIKPFLNYPSVMGEQTRDAILGVVGGLLWIVAFSASLILNLFFYVLIVYTLYHHGSSRNSQLVGRGGTHAHDRHELRAVGKMLVINGTVFFFCLTPWYTYIFILVLSSLHVYISPGIVYPCYLISNMLIYANSMTNPFIYGAFNARYRAALLNAVNVFCPKQKNNTSSRSL